MDVRADLRLAVRLGFLLLPVPGSGIVEITGAVLRFDPAMPALVRARAVLRLLRTRNHA